MNAFRVASGIITSGVWFYAAMSVSRPWDIALGGIAGLCLAMGFKESKTLEEPKDTKK